MPNLQTKADLIENLRTIRDEASDRMKDAQRDLSKRRGEHDSILQGRSRLLQLFEQFQDQLDRAGNALLELYRGTNRKIRQSAAPKRFEDIWHLDRITVGAEISEIVVRTNLSEEIKNAHEILTREIGAIHEAFERAVEGYHQIDDLLIAGNDEPIPFKAAKAQVV
jgi:uncharacterized protein YukE